MTCHTKINAAAAVKVPKGARPVMLGSAVAGYTVTPTRPRWFNLVACRAREIDDLFRHRHVVVLPSEDEARRFAAAISHHATPDQARRWIEGCCLALDDDTVEAIVSAAVFRPRRYKASTLGRLLRLTPEERDLVGITTFSAEGVTKRQMAANRRRKDRERKRTKRAANPPTPKARKPAAWKLSGKSHRTFFRHQKQGAPERATSREALKPWVSAGVSQRTWYRRLAATRDTGTGTGTASCPQHYTSLWHGQRNPGDDIESRRRGACRLSDDLQSAELAAAPPDRLAGRRDGELQPATGPALSLRERRAGPSRSVAAEEPHNLMPAKVMASAAWADRCAADVLVERVARLCSLDARQVRQLVVDHGLQVTAHATDLLTAYLADGKKLMLPESFLRRACQSAPRAVSVGTR